MALNHPTIDVIVFVSLGGVLFLAFFAAALFFLFKKTKKKTVQETEIVHLDEHKKIKGAVVGGPHGVIDTVALSVEDDIHIDKDIKRNEKVGEGHASTSGSNQPHLEHKASLC